MMWAWDWAVVWGQSVFSWRFCLGFIYSTWSLVYPQCQNGRTDWSYKKLVASLLELMVSIINLVCTHLIMRRFFRGPEIGIHQKGSRHKVRSISGLQWRRIQTRTPLNVRLFQLVQCSQASILVLLLLRLVTTLFLVSLLLSNVSHSYSDSQRGDWIGRVERCGMGRGIIKPCGSVSVSFGVQLRQKSWHASLPAK